MERNSKNKWKEKGAWKEDGKGIEIEQIMILNEEKVKETRSRIDINIRKEFVCGEGGRRADGRLCMLVWV